MFTLLSTPQTCSSSTIYPSHHLSKRPPVSPSSHHPLSPFALTLSAPLQTPPSPPPHTHTSPSSHLAASRPVVATFPLHPAPRGTATRARTTCPPYLGLSKGSHRAAARPLLAPPPPLPPSRRRHLRAPGRGTALSRRGCGADAPPPLPRSALGSEGAPGRPAPAGHVVPPRPPPGRHPLSPTSLTCQPPRGSSAPRWAQPARPLRGHGPRCRAPLPLCGPGPERGAGEARDLCIWEVPDTLVWAPGVRFEGSTRRRGELRKAATSLRASVEKGKVVPPRPLPALSQQTAPRNYLARERQGGSPSARPQPSQCCRAAAEAGFRDRKGCYSP